MLSQRTYLLCESILIFGIVPPVAAACKPHGWMYIMLWVFAWLTWRWLVKYKNYNVFEDWNKTALNRDIVVTMFARFVPLSILLCAFTYFMIPDHLFSLPRDKPQIWVMVMVFYPLLSVIPQEIIFRSFFFRRYQKLFATPTAMILASSLAFGWIHILLLNWVAVIFSALGGIIFASTYTKTHSLAVVCLEHALYGCMIFTLGLGYYFYHGQAVH